MKIGVMFGNPETTTGGNALKFYSSVRMDIRQRDKIVKDGEVVGHARRVKVVKNKIAPPFKEATFNIIYPTGIDKESSIIDAGISAGVLEQAGSWIKYGEENLAQGVDKAADELRENDKLRKEIVKKIRAAQKA
jgi:recombination protein RecA